MNAEISTESRRRVDVTTVPELSIDRLKSSERTDNDKHTASPVGHSSDVVLNEAVFGQPCHCRFVRESFRVQETCALINQIQSQDCLVS